MIGKGCLRYTGFQMSRSTPTAKPWLGDIYPLRFKKDPVPGWQKQVDRLRSKRNPHAALASYAASVEHKGQLREALNESAMAAEAEIDRQIDAR